MRKRLSLLLCLLLLTCLMFGCGITEGKQEDALQLYYGTMLSECQGGDAIGSVSIRWDTLPQGDELAQAEAVLALLLGGCEDSDYHSPVPEGTTLRSAELKGSTLSVDFSTAYTQLSGMDLTVADYCVALSLTQIPGIYAVRITVNGQELAYRDTNLFLAGDVLLTSTEDVVRTLTARLWFPDATGVLTAEERLLTLYEGQSTVDVVLSALAGGPESDKLQPLLTEGFVGMTAHLEEGVCHLNIPGADITLLGTDVAVRQVVQATKQSLLSLEGVSSVLVYVDGELNETYG